jgi:hypothetical protein
MDIINIKLLLLNHDIDWGRIVSFTPLLIYLQKVTSRSLQLRGRMDRKVVLESAYKE